MNKENALIKEYLEIYKVHYYKGCDRKGYKKLRNILIEYKDQLPLLDKDYIAFMLDVEAKTYPTYENYGNDELLLILDKNKLPFDTHYCYCMNTILKSLSYSQITIKNEELMKLSKEYTKMKHGFECYLSESVKFREYMKQIINITGVKPNEIITDYIAFISAFLYYNSIDPKVVYDLSITFMCYYEEILDKFKMNGFTIVDEFNNDYFNIFANIIMSVKNNHKEYKKVLS